MGEFCNMGKLWCGRIAIRPYDTRKRPHAMPVMLFAYNICQRSDNARVGANCNSPSPVYGQFALQTYERNREGNKKVKNYHSNSSLRVV